MICQIKRTICAGLVALMLMVGLPLPTQGSTNPIASFTPSVTSTMAHTPITFDASASRDARGYSRTLEYSWDWQQTYEWTPWSRNAKITHSFAEPGEYSVRLRIRDTDGLLDETAALIRINEKRAPEPITSFFVQPNKGDTSTAFEFTVSPVSTANTPTHLLQVRWDWQGDGTWDTDWSTARRFFHAFTETGQREVWVETRDPLTGGTSTERGYYVTGKENDAARTVAIGRIEVTDANGTRAAFRTWPVEGVVGVNVFFEATGTIRGDELRWDFDGDGTWDTAWSREAKAQHSYQNSGTYQTILAVRYPDGSLDRTTRQVRVLDDAAGIPPEAWFSLRNLTHPTDPTFGVLLDEFYLDASGSRDRDGSLSTLQVRWDWEGDGVWDTSFARTKSALHRYTEVGDFRPRVEVLDSQGHRATAELAVRIVANTAPRAMLSINPARAVPGSDIRFDASGSDDDQSRASQLQARFDFESDGVWDTQWSTAKSISHRVQVAGQYQATVEVRDHANLVATTTADYTVYDPAMPQAFFRTSPGVGTFATDFFFDASGANVTESVWYRWDFSSGGSNDIQFDTGWSTTTQVRHRYGKVGSHQVHLQVKNSVGQISDFYSTIRIHPSSPDFEYLRRRGVLTSDIPLQPITRAELAQILARASQIRVPSLRLQPFVDVHPRDWFAASAAAVVQRGWLSAREHFRFEPTRDVQRAEAARAVVSALYPFVATDQIGSDFFRDVQTDSYWARFASVLTQEKLFSNKNGRFGPEQPITRAEVATWVAGLLRRYDLPKIKGEIARYNRGAYTSSLLNVGVDWSQAWSQVIGR